MLARTKAPARFGALLGLLVLTAVALPAAAAEVPDEGIDYRTVEQPARAEPGDGVEVLELFWYGCPHCYHLEPDIKKWLATDPADVVFRRMPATSSPRWVPHAKAYFAAEMMGVLEQLHEPLFKALHEQRRPIMTEDEIVEFAGEQGIDKEEFRAAMASFPVDMQVRKATDLVNRYRIDGVPAMVVNGKFVTSASQTGSTGRMFEVIDYLVAREAGAAGEPQQSSATDSTESGG